MMLLLADDQIAARRAAAAGPLQPLAQSLAREVEPLLDRELYFPREKALLSREGGRCARDGALLDFDPFAPHEHSCPRCGTIYTGELHDRFWIYWYQLWLAERAVHAALLDTLLPGERFRGLAEQILEGYAARYASYPNRDNVLGPTRLFFSTYLESIWLLQIAVASDLLRPRSPHVADRALERIVEPSRAIIAEYDEGASNRQVWNNAALLAAARLLGDDAAADAVIHGPSGLVSHLAGGLLPDGTWYEGENYHLFAHRGLWYGVAMAEQARAALPPDLVKRFQAGFGAPFLTALPDYTLPSRRDSQYAISLRQWRIAEHCELGFARHSDRVLGGALARLYGDDIPRRDTGRWRSSADVERNAPASALTRADLSWRALLCAKPELPALEELEALVPRSVLLPAQGIAVFRRENARAYVALDYGHSGGGHGHPDRLNLLLVRDTTRWLDDYGTGSYVDPSLHWYRSTLAHNAPLVDGRSQRPASGRLVAYDERGATGWVSAALDDAVDGVAISRSIVVVDGYLVDTLSWTADRDVTLDLPMHADVELDGLPPLEPAAMIGDAGLEDGFAFLQNAHVQSAAADRIVYGAAGSGGHKLELWCRASTAAEWWRAVAPGPPGDGDRTFRVVRCRGRAGRIQSVLSWRGQVAGIEPGTDHDVVRAALIGDATHLHCKTNSGWRITISGHGPSETIDLGGFVAQRERGVDVATAPAAASTPTTSLPVGHDPTIVELGETHYRRSELRWADAGRPTARVSLHVAEGALHIGIDVSPSARLFAAADAVNIHDNEHPDINGDGVQLYIDGADGPSAWTLVPELGTTAVRTRSIDARRASRRVDAAWHPTDRGYCMEIVAHSPLPQFVEVVVNLISPGRARREGQLVLSGARNEFVYLRGDRHDASRLVRLRYNDE